MSFLLVNALVAVHPREEALTLEGPPTALPQLAAMELVVLERPPKGQRVPSRHHGCIPHGEQRVRIYRVLKKLSARHPVVCECSDDDAGHLLLQLLADELLDDGLEVRHPDRVPEPGRLMLVRICLSWLSTGW